MCRIQIAVASLGAMVLCGSAVAEGAMSSLYELVVETSMPHLEESLRYTKTTSTQCLTKSELLVTFPVLAEDAFRGCRLSKQALSDTHAAYRLVCPTSTGTTGTAIWRFDASRLAGTLEVKLGGKNMTFHQRVTAMRMGECGRRSDNDRAALSTRGEAVRLAHGCRRVADVCAASAALVLRGVHVV